MTLASSQGNQPYLARLPTGLPKTQAEWTQFVNALQAWQRGVQNVSWESPTLLNGWEYYGAPYEPPGYYMDAAGRVHLRGLLKSGTVGSTTPFFTLPRGYIPPYDLIVPAVSNDALCEIRIVSTTEFGATPGSAAVWSGGNNSWVSLSGISFSTV